MASPKQRPRNDLDNGACLVLVALVALLAAILSTTAVAPALAQASAAARAGVAGASPQPAVTPTEARQALDVLQDANRRDALIETLQTIAKTQAPDPSRSPAPGGGETASGAPALVADGFGAEALSQASAKIEEISSQIAHSVRATTKFPVLWRWVVKTARDGQARDLALGFLWRLAMVASLALLAERLMRLALRGPFTALVAHAARRGIAIGASEYHSVQGGVASSQIHRLSRLWRPFARLPFAAARLLLDIAPVIAFAVVINILLAAGIGAEPVSRIAILALASAYVLCRSLMSLVGALACGREPQTSLFTLPGETAAAIETWIRRIVVVTVFGLAFANVALALGLRHPAYVALVKLVVLVAHLLVLAATLRFRQPVAAFIRAPEGNRGFVSTLRNRFADVWHYVAIFANLALWLVWALHIRNGYRLIAYYALTTMLALAVARAVSNAALVGLDRAFHAGSGFIARHPNAEALVDRYHGALRGAVSATISIFAGVALLEAWGFGVLAWFEQGRFGASLVSQFSAVAIAIAVALVVWEASNGMMERQLARLVREGHYMRAARLKTLLPMLRTALILTILTIVGLTALSAIGVNIAPLLAGASIVGIAVGFGSQKLVQDVVTGLFLLLENAMQVGDFVTVSGLSGTVENLSIRTIRLRAGDGSVHIIPFSSVTSVTNTNRGIGNAAVSVNLAYDEDIDRASEVLKQIAAEMRQDSELRPMMRGDLALWGVDKVDGAMVTIVGQIECTASGRWPVQREFNRRMKIRFQQLGVDIAHPAQARLVADAFSLRSIREPANGAAE
jgi:small-conductance mechanosensitive channel